MLVDFGIRLGWFLCWISVRVGFGVFWHVVCASEEWLLLVFGLVWFSCLLVVDYVCLLFCGFVVYDVRIYGGVWLWVAWDGVVMFA